MRNKWLDNITDEQYEILYEHVFQHLWDYVPWAMKLDDVDYMMDQTESYVCIDMSWEQASKLLNIQ